MQDIYVFPTHVQSRELGDGKVSFPHLPSFTGLIPEGSRVMGGAVPTKQGQN